MNRSLTISFGSGEKRPHNAQFATITGAREFSWEEFSSLLTASPPEADDKSSFGWYIPAKFTQRHRDSEYFEHRDALTLDYDTITPDDLKTIVAAFKGYAYAIYTTASHTAASPRVRVVIPTTRSMSADEFCAVSRKVASWAGIELASRESHVPAQMMYLPTRKPGQTFAGKVEKGQWLDVDAVLGMYDDWKNRALWPARKDHDSTHSAEDLPTPPNQKPGVVGDFCRAFNVHQAIQRFQLPYAQVNENRYTYTNGSSPEGAVVHDDGQKLHSYHDTDPAHGQHNAFDLVRLHRFGSLDGADAGAVSITDKPSFKAMVSLALEQPEVQAAQVGADFEVLPPLTEEERPAEAASTVSTQPAASAGTGGDSSPTRTGLARKVSDAINSRTIPRWLLKDILERGVLAVLAGPRGTYKSFTALDWAMRCALNREPVYVLSAEGGDFDRRAKAWLIEHDHVDEVETIPLYVAEKRIDLSTKDGIELIRADCAHHKIMPVLFVLDTFSKLSGGLDENDNSKVKHFIGMLDNGLKRAYGATVLLVAHTGHTEQGRPRGASALGADTDAEYMVSRNETDNVVSVTRQRFKASPELAPLHYQPEIVDLDYSDEDGRIVTSVVMMPIEAPANQAKRIIIPKQPGRMMAIVREKCAESEAVSITALLDAFVAATPQDPEGKDRRRRNGMRAIDWLIERKLIVLRDPETIALTKVQQTAATNFKKENE